MQLTHKRQKCSSLNPLPQSINSQPHFNFHCLCTTSKAPAYNFTVQLDNYKAATSDEKVSEYANRMKELRELRPVTTLLGVVEAELALAHD